MECSSSRLPLFTGLWVVLGCLGMVLTSVGVLLSVTGQLDAWGIGILAGGIALLALWLVFRWPLPRVRAPWVSDTLRTAARRRAEQPPVEDPELGDARHREARRRRHALFWRWARPRRAIRYSSQRE